MAPLLDAIELLTARPGVAQARLHGDRAQVIITPGAWTPETLTARLVEGGIHVEGVEAVEPALEDVFTLLAHQSPASMTFASRSRPKERSSCPS